MLLAFPPHIPECLTIINKTAIAFRSSSVRWRRGNEIKTRSAGEFSIFFSLLASGSPRASEKGEIWAQKKKIIIKGTKRKEKIKTETTDETGLMDANNLQGSLDIYKGCLRS